MMIQFGIINNVMAKECIIAGFTNDKSTEVICKNYFNSFKTKTDALGRFNLKMTLNSPQYFQLQIDKTINVFLVPGDSIYIDFIHKGPVSSGSESALISNYLINWFAYIDSSLANFDRVAFYSSNPDVFDSAVNNLYKTLQAPFNAFELQYPAINTEFMRLEKERLKFWIWCPLNRYEYRYQSYTGKKVQIPKKFYDYLNHANFNDSTFLQLSDFNDFITTYLEMKVFKAVEHNQKAYEDPYFKTKVLLNTIKETFTNQRILDDILNKNIHNQIYYMDVNDSLFSVVEKIIKNQKYIKGLRGYYNSMKKFQPGTPAPSFELKDIKGSTYTLSHFKGKYLLLDVWGIYCGPCIKEIPKLKEIEVEFKDANITFVQVNLEGTKEAWIKKVEDLDLKGIQLMANKGWDSEFQKAYRIDSVPSFILIDRDGRFIDARTQLPSENLRSVLYNLPEIKRK